jgi:hypothetical protein
MIDLEREISCLNVMKDQSLRAKIAVWMNVVRRNAAQIDVVRKSNFVRQNVENSD